MVPKSSSEMLSRVPKCKKFLSFSFYFFKGYLAGYGILGSVTFFQNLKLPIVSAGFIEKSVVRFFSLLKKIGLFPL